MSVSGRDDDKLPRIRIGAKAVLMEPRTRLNVRLPTAKLNATRTRLAKQERAGETVNGRKPSLTAVLEQGLDEYLKEEDDVEPA